MAELKLEERFGELSDRAEALHDKVYSRIKSEIPDFGKQEVFVNHSEEDEKSSGKIILTPDLEHLWNIGLHPSVAEFDEEYKEFGYFKKFQKEKEVIVSTEDFFKYVLTHEYGHLFLYKGNPFNVLGMYGDFGFKEQEKILRYKNAISEGFACWFGDSFSGFKEFNPIRALSNADKSDPRLLKEMYEVYERIEANRGRTFVLQNHEDIAVKYVKWRERNSVKPNPKK